MCIITEDTLIGVRDSNGIRPLCLGKVGDGYIMASESCAIDAVNGEYIRDIAPGEIVMISKDGIKSFMSEEKIQKQTVFLNMYILPVQILLLTAFLFRKPAIKWVLL